MARAPHGRHLSASDGPSGRGAAALAALGIVVYSWPLVPRLGSELLGDPFGEVDNHLWMSAFGGRADAPLRNFPVGFDLPLMDPVHLLWWVPGGVFGPVFAYNVAALGDLALAALGGWALARELGASRAGALVGMAATAFSPFLAGMMEFGIAESWPVGWLALHAALLLRFGRTQSLATLAGAGASLGAFLLSGWYNAAFALVAEAPLALWAVTRAPSMRAHLTTLAGVALQGLLAALPLLPRWEETQAKAAIWAPRLSGLTRPQTYTDWDGNPRFGTDLLTLFSPHTAELPVARTAYLGLIVLALALVGLGRRAGWAALAIAAPLAVLALGHWLRVGGVPVEGLGPLPAGWLVAQVPTLQGISHWYRAIGPATVFLAAAAAMGATTLLARLPRPGLVAPALAALVLTDTIALSPTPWPRVTYTPDPPTALLALPKPGALLQLPFDEGRGLTNIASRRVYDQWQVFHRRAVAEHYEGRDALLYRSSVVAVWQRACAARAPLVPAARSPEDELEALVDLGVAYVIVHPEYAKPGCADAVERRLGPPTLRDERTIAWDLSRAIEVSSSAE